MATKKKRKGGKRKARKHHCVFAGKTKIACFKNKGAAKKSARARRKRGLKGSVKTRAVKR